MSGNRTTHPGDDGSMDLGFGPDPARHTMEQRPDPGGHVTLTQEQFEQLLGSVQESRAELDYARAAGVAPQAAPQQQADPLVEMFNQLPDAARDPEGFKRGLQGVLGAAMEMGVARASQVQTQMTEQTNIYDEAWQLLQQEYPDIAAHPEIVQMATTREMEALRAKGLDPLAVFTNNMGEAVKAIADRSLGTIQRVRGYSDGEDPDVDAPERTDMLTGGSGYRPRPQARSAPSGGLVTEIQKIQREMGIY